ncbi:hypothetical protein O6H91_02G030100 [Diphasiastrum complanatum]|uniref:Uncharacterized protein n=1 Tax=Diphasiastrum complanatum TaxID=34168 RepID=A0ACC2EDP9_DIPCM|nr:hypothetical protein O6H91_02G030100 [Diphasiastrum complanatum]
MRTQLQRKAINLILVLQIVVLLHARVLLTVLCSSTSTKSYMQDKILYSFALIFPWSYVRLTLFSFCATSSFLQIHQNGPSSTCSHYSATPSFLNLSSYGSANKSRVAQKPRPI